MILTTADPHWGPPAPPADQIAYFILGDDDKETVTNYNGDVTPTSTSPEDFGVI